MKKITLLFAAVFAALSFSACQKEQVLETPQEGLKVNIEVADLNTGTDTKAVKTDWVSGDRIFVWFDQNIQKTPDLVIKYNGSNWSKDTEATVSGNAPESSSGRIMAAYIAAGNLDGFDWTDLSETNGYPYGNFGFNQGISLVGDDYPFVNVSLVALSQQIPYSYEDNELSANISSWFFPNNVQVVITGLEGDWALSCDQLKPSKNIALSNTSMALWAFEGASTGRATCGTSNADGLAFYFSAADSETKDYTFTLYNLSTDQTLTYTAANQSLSAVPTDFAAIRIAGTKFKKPVPKDALSGEFSINSNGDKVRFAKGNLYYDGTNWALEANQYDYRTYSGFSSCINGTTTTNGTPSGNHGLFFWTLSTENSIKDTNSETELPASAQIFAETDNTILGGVWSLLTYDEWKYLLETRANASSKIGFATVAGVHGAILLPDNFTDPKKNKLNSAFVPQSTTGYDANIYYAGDNWNAMESAGAVFLPASGTRCNQYEMNFAGSSGGYWTASPTTTDNTLASKIAVESSYVSTGSALITLANAIRFVFKP